MSPGDSLVVFRRAPRALRRKLLQDFAGRLWTEVAGQRHFLVLITDDRELRRLNRDFLAKDYPTDVLSFPEGNASGALGEIAISVQRAAEQAAERGYDCETEIQVLMLHGLLHLQGMDHEKDRGRMKRTETRWRKTLGLPGGLIERSGQ